MMMMMIAKIMIIIKNDEGNIKRIIYLYEIVKPFTRRCNVAISASPSLLGQIVIIREGPGHCCDP
tara:strand:- start:357 stop:551 length:195 start_codon:yes stop_codon:yes gene_type:complete